MKYINTEKLIVEIERRKQIHKRNIENGFPDEANKILEDDNILSIITSLQQEQPDEQPEYGYLYTEYIHGKKSNWNVGDILAYYISTSNEEGEYILGKIVNIEFDEESGWIYIFEDESTWDEQSLVENGTYKKN